MQPAPSPETQDVKDGRTKHNGWDSLDLFVFHWTGSILFQMASQPACTFSALELAAAVGGSDISELAPAQPEVTMSQVVVCASGYFDPIHWGHVEYLQKAKDLGTKLVVIVNNDRQAALKKGRAFMPCAGQCPSLFQMSATLSSFLAVIQSHHMFPLLLKQSASSWFVLLPVSMPPSRPWMRTAPFASLLPFSTPTSSPREEIKRCVAFKLSQSFTSVCVSLTSWAACFRLEPSPRLTFAGSLVSRLLIAWATRFNPQAG